jgi:hypothetical protein
MFAAKSAPFRERLVREGEFRQMKTALLAAAALALAFAAPAHAQNTAITIWNTANPGGAETDTATNIATVGPANLSGVTVETSIGTRVTSSFNEINGAQILLTNTTGSSQTIEIAVGAINYLGVDDRYHQSATINLQQGTADLAGSFFVDALDRFGGTSVSNASFGVNNFSFDSMTLDGPFAFSKNNLAIGPLSGPLYSMGETLKLTLSAGAVVGVQGISMTAAPVPEPRTWIMALLGFGLLGIIGARKAREGRFAL